ncbi:penicillin-insensitive murein endopeptidase [Streptomyces sp. NPDC059957]|uniref:penicillin-insensitive murein endopeptidase n=1 Tax=unclassified Streptomyces TaxID=2593676 RepID=UPI0036566737
MSIRAGVRVGVSVSAAVMLAVAGPAADAAAYDRAAFPAQSTGNRGTDVLALQHLLTAADQTTPVNGHFDTATAAALKRFQSAHGLASDAIAGPATWTSLTPTLREGASGPAVRALQSELTTKSGSSLTVDGVFGAATKTAVVRFQSQAGLAADGVAGPATWKNLLWHFERVDAAPNNLCDQDPDGNTAANWGTAAAVAQLEAAAKAFAATGRGRVPFGDLSWELGGDIPGHASHEQGLDADIWPIRTDSAQCTAGRITWRSTEYDRAATRRLVQEIRKAAPGHVKTVYFNDPQLISEGLTASYPNHDNHLHVRYCEAVHPNPDADADYRC